MNDEAPGPSPESDLPATLDSAFHRDLRGRTHEPWARRVALSALFAVVALALLNVFGQQPTTSSARGPQATLSVAAPTRVRGGLLFQARIQVAAITKIGHPRIMLGAGWLEQMQVNTIEPSPTAETSRDGHLILSYDAIAPDQKLTVWMEFQVDPLSAGRRDQSVELLDGGTPVARIARHLTDFP